MGNGQERQVRRLPDLLVEVGLVDRFQLQRAAVLQKQTGARLCRALVDNGFVEEERLVRTLSAALKLESVSLSSIKIHERVLSRIPTRLARSAGALPVAIKRANHTDYLYVAMADPMDGEAIAELQRVTGCTLSVLIAPPTQLDGAIERYYGAGTGDRQQAPASSPPASRPPPQNRPVLTPAADAATKRPVANPQPSRHAQPPTNRGLVKPSGMPTNPNSGARRGAPSGPPPADMTPGPRLPPLRVDRSSGDEARTQIDPAALADSGKAPAIVRVHDTGGSEPAESEAGGFALPDIVPASAWDDGKTLDVDIDEMDPADLQQLLAPAGMPSMKDALAKKKAATSEAMELSDVVDGGEEMATSEVDLNAPGAAGLVASVTPMIEETEAQVSVHEEPTKEPYPVSGDFISAMELPIEFADSPSPFDGLEQVSVPAGLERTGIIPVIDWDREEFEPPPPEEAPHSDHARHLIGLGDIPGSVEQVRARSGSDAPPRPTPSPPPPKKKTEPRSSLPKEQPEGEPEAKEPSAPPPKKLAPPPAVTETSAPEDLPEPVKPSAPPKPLVAPKPMLTPKPAVISKPAPAPKPSVPPQPSVPPKAQVTPKPSVPPKAQVTPKPSVPPKPMVPKQPASKPSVAPKSSVAPKELATAKPSETAEASTSPELDLEPLTAPKPQSLPPPAKNAEEPTNPRIASAEIEDALEQDPTPAADRLDRDAVLAELNEPAPAPSTPPPAADEDTRLVATMLAGRSLTSADRARLVLAIGRVLVAKGVISAEDIAGALRE